MNLEDRYACGVSGWGWQNDAYWLSQPAQVTFATSGRTCRIQVREDGAQVDQVIRSPSRFLVSVPGRVKNDTTIVPKSCQLPAANYQVFSCQPSASQLAAEN